jgi:hypothetical protein
VDDVARRMLWETAKTLKASVKKCSRIEDLRKEILEVADSLQSQVQIDKKGKA